jgi:hypothetical protein
MIPAVWRNPIDLRDFDPLFIQAFCELFQPDIDSSSYTIIYEKFSKVTYKKLTSGINLHECKHSQVDSSPLGSAIHLISQRQ